MEFLKHLLTLSEGKDPHIKLTLQRIIVKGKADNHFDFLVLARIILSIDKNISVDRTDFVFDGMNSVPKELLDHLKMLDASSIVTMAAKFLAMFENNQPCCLAASARYLEIIRAYTASEANE